ncbi:MAG: hypothetical protein WCV80_01465 [Candidatus Paceibacterota bacterium]|jgi:thymidylate kinase
MAFTHEQETNFEIRANRLLKYLKKDIRHNRDYIPRPFIVEVTGSPSAGKTTTIVEIDKFFRRMDFSVWKPQEGAEVIRYITRDTPVYNARTGLYALTNVIDQAWGHQHDLVIFDRALFDAHVWMMYWEEKGKLSKERKQLFQQFFLDPFWANYIDAAFFMICDPELAIIRERENALTQKLGETTNLKTVTSLVNRYKEAYEVLSPSYPNLHLFDTTNVNKQEMSGHIAEYILSALEAKNLNGS